MPVKRDSPNPEVAAVPEGAQVGEQPPERSTGLRTDNRGAFADAQMVQQCLAGDQQAWEQLYHRCHPRLMEAVRFLLGSDGRDGHLVEEIAARVWYCLLQDDARLLAQYDATRQCRLGVFLVGLARIEIMQHMRAERRRRSRELTGGRRWLKRARSSERQMAGMMAEFAATLTSQEREFLETFLLELPAADVEEDQEELSATSIWQRRHRIRFKLQEFLRDF